MRPLGVTIPSQRDTAGLDSTGRYLRVYALLAIVSLGDILTTIYGLESGSFAEANPVVAGIMSRGGYALWLAYYTMALAAVTGITVCSYAVLRRAVGDRWRWMGYAPAVTWMVMHAAVTAHNASLLLSV